MALFGLEHCLTLLVLAAAAVVLCVATRRSLRADESGRAARLICRGMAALLLLNAVFGQALAIAQGYWSWQESLPLHLCDIGVVVTAVALVVAVPRRTELSALSIPPSAGMTDGVHPAPGQGDQAGRTSPFRGALLFELAYYWGLAGTVQALITPSIEQTFPDTACLQFFVMHGGVVVSVLVLVFGVGLCPRPGSVWRVWLTTAALAPPVGLVNWLIGANYMYLCGPPPRASLYDYFGPWPWSLIILGAVGLALFGICYLPVRLSRFLR